MSKTKKYGFWVIPENKTYQVFERIIRKYSKKYNAPMFVPHMTIHGVIESTEEKVVRGVKKVADKIRPFEVQVGEVEFSTTYFQCVFARIKTNAKLLNTYLALRDSLEFTEKHVFMPHASLVYGDFDMETREKISKEIEFSNEKFMVNKITIVKADSRDPKNWHIVEQVQVQ